MPACPTCSTHELPGTSAAKPWRQSRASQFVGSSPQDGARPLPLGEGTENSLPVYQGTVRLEVPLAVAADAPPGEYALTLAVRFQPCSHTDCRAPDERTVTRKVRVTEGTGQQ